MPISCGFAGSTYETICHLVTVKTAIQAIKKPVVVALIVQCNYHRGLVCKNFKKIIW